MTPSIIKSIKPIAKYYADVVSFATKGYYAFDAEDWAEALPGRRTATAITVETEFSYQIHNQPDFEAEVGYRFLGDFRKSGGAWSGTVDRLQFLRDGEVVGVIDLGSEVDVGRVLNVGGSGLIWNELTVSGLKGAFSRANDDVHGSLGDDVLDLGKGHDRINASRGDDVVRGGGGRDLIDGFDGNDRLYGGGGADRFVFEPGEGIDRVLDFENDVDLLDLSAYGLADKAAFKALVTVKDGNLVVDLGGGAEVTIEGMKLKQILDDVLL